MYFANEVMFPQLNVNRLQEATKTSTLLLSTKLRVSFSLPDGCFQSFRHFIVLNFYGITELPNFWCIDG